MRRQARDDRRRGVRIRLSSRDELLLRALVRFRMARSRDLVELAFADIRADTAARRLRKLFDAGFLDVRVGDRTKENVYALGPKGQALVASQGQSIGRVPTGRIGHHLAIVREWARLARAVHDTPGLRVELARPEWEIRDRLTATGSAVVPDALVQIGIQDRGVVRLALEVDLGSEAMVILRRKIACYESVRQSADGLFGWRVFVLAVALVDVGVSRGPAIMKLLDETWSGPWLLWCDSEELSAALRSLVSDEQPPLTTYPYCKGRETGVTAYGDERSRTKQAGLSGE